MRRASNLGALCGQIGLVFKIPLIPSSFSPLCEIMLVLVFGVVKNDLQRENNEPLRLMRVNKLNDCFSLC